MEDIRSTVKTYILSEFLPGEDPEELTYSVPLITGGVLDSLATLKLVAFLEEQYHFEMLPHEVNADNLNTISNIANYVESKTGESP